MVSIFAGLRRMLAAPAVLHGDMPGPPTSIASPLSRPNHLAHVMAPDWFPASIDRDRAMRVPAVARARLVICSTIAGYPLVVSNRSGRLDRQPPWVDRTSGPISPYHRMLWTVDDLLFYGVSLWAVDRGADRQVLAADRVPWDAWTLTNDGIVFHRRNTETGTVTDELADPDSVILIPGNDGGLLEHGIDAIAQALAISASVGRFVANPSAYLELHQTNDVPISVADRDELIAGWAAARRGESGGVAFTSAGVEVREHGAAQEHLLIEGRTAAALDIARAAGIPGAIVDAVIGEGLTYQNADTKTGDLHRYGLSSYTRAISARLGLDDMVPAGQSVAFRLTSGEHIGTPDDGAPSNVTPIVRPTAGASDA